MNLRANTRLAATAMLAGLSLILTGCFVTPGKFTSELVLEEGNRFTFTYEGEIFFAALANLAQMGAGEEEFEPSPCYIDNTDEERECSANELASQRAMWDAEAEARAENAAMEAEQMAAMMGGIDPSDPEAAAELARNLERQRGWNSVVDKGDGVFEVSYSASGQMSHDFMFPMIEGFPTVSPFVQVILRDNNVVRVNAPGFAAEGEGGGMGGMTNMMGMASMSRSEDPGPDMPDTPLLDGTFTIITKGNIRANNTDEGSTTTARGEALVWNITPRTKDAPTALIDLSR